MGICDSVSNKRQREQNSMNRTNTFSSIQNTNIMQPSSSQNQPGFYSSRAYQKQPSVKPALTRTATVFQKGEKFYKKNTKKSYRSAKNKNNNRNVEKIAGKKATTENVKMKNVSSDKMPIVN